MVDASIKIVGGPIRVEHEKIETNYTQKKEPQKTFNDIIEAIQKYKVTTEMKDRNYQTDSTALYD